jgi:hypothetical protein
MMGCRTLAAIGRGLILASVLVAPIGCGGTQTEDDTAEVVKDKPGEPAKTVPVKDETTPEKPKE